MKKQYIKPVVTVVKMTESHAIMAGSVKLNGFVKPTKFAYLFFGKLVICLRGNHALRPCPEKKNHNLSSKLGNNGAKITINAHMAK